MKKILFATAIALAMTSCEEPGTTRTRIRGDESSLPAELKGLKVYAVSMPNGRLIYVPVLFAGQINSVNYKVGKTTESVILMIDSRGLVIPISEVILENDSVIVAKKRK